MSHGGNDGCKTNKNSFRDAFFIEGPQVFKGSSAASYDNDVNAKFIQGTDTAYDAVLGCFSLYDRRI